MQSHRPRMLMSIVESQASSVCSWVRPTSSTMPALLKAKSRPPNVETVVSTIASTCSGIAMSAWMKTASPPLSRILAATRSPSADRLAAIATLAPSRANCSADASPMPAFPPVTRATLPSNCPPTSLPPCVPEAGEGFLLAA